MGEFDGKAALVTGSGRGIGRGIALRLAYEGADIIVNYFRNRKPAEQTADEIRELGRRAIVVKANVGDLDQLAAMYDVIGDEIGYLDILIHNAASGYLRPALDQKPKGWEWTMNINARSLLFGAQHAARLMKGRKGSIIAISSLGSVRAFPDYVVVGASKAAIESIVRYLGVELSPQGISVNTISPGMVKTDALEHFDIYAQEGQKLLDEAVRRTPAGRLCTPEDIAELVCFLCSPRAEMICGQTIVIDGGYSIDAKS